MAEQTGVVEPIREAGAGGEARIIVELRTLFPGLDGAIVTQGGLLPLSGLSTTRPP